jgi:hypothetical protein
MKEPSRWYSNSGADTSLHAKIQPDGQAIEENAITCVHIWMEYWQGRYARVQESEYLSAGSHVVTVEAVDSDVHPVVLKVCADQVASMPL